jgi:uncharacterized membrane protein (DUF2068 family)
MSAPASSSVAPSRHGAGVVRLIGVFKLGKGLLSVAAAISVFDLIHKDLGDVVLEWARRLHVDPGNKVVQDLLVRALTVTKRQLFVLGFVLVAYAVMFTIEGIGLVLVKHWAEWMTVITTCALIPFEVYEIIHRPTWIKIAALTINIAAAVYLIVRVRSDAKERRAKEGLSSN